MKLELTQDDLWPVTYALMQVTSDEGVQRFTDEFPEADLDQLAEKIDTLAKKIRALVPK